MPIDQQFVEYVIKSLVTYPDDVIVDRTIDEKGVLLTLTVNPEDLGRVIGKRGATAQSVRTLLRALGTKNEARYNMKIVDNGEPKPEREAKKAADDTSAQPAQDDNSASDDSGSGWSSSSTSSDDDYSSDSREVAETAANDSGEEESAIERTRRELEDLDDLDV